MTEAATSAPTLENSATQAVAPTAAVPISEAAKQLAYRNVLGSAASLAAKQEVTNQAIAAFIKDHNLGNDEAAIKDFFSAPMNDAQNEFPKSLASLKASPAFTTLQRQVESRNVAYGQYVAAYRLLFEATTDAPLIKKGSHDNTARALVRAIDNGKPRLEAINASLNAAAADDKNNTFPTFNETFKNKAFPGNFSKEAYEKTVQAADWANDTTQAADGMFSSLYQGAINTASKAMTSVAGIASGAEKPNVWGWAAGGIGALIAFFVGRMFLGNGIIGTIAGGLLAFLGFSLGKDYVDGMNAGPESLRAPAGGAGQSVQVPCNEPASGKTSTPRGAACKPLDPTARQFEMDGVNTSWVNDFTQNPAVAFHGPTQVSYTADERPGWTYTPRSNSAGYKIIA
jgi:hypothetical protein